MYADSQADVNNVVWGVSYFMLRWNFWRSSTEPHWNTPGFASVGGKKRKKLHPSLWCQQTSHGSYESSTHALLNCGSRMHTHSEVTERFMLVAPLFLLEPQSKSWGLAILTVVGAILAVIM